MSHTDCGDLKVVGANDESRRLQFVANSCVLNSIRVIEWDRVERGERLVHDRDAAISVSVLFGAVKQLGTYDRAGDDVSWLQ